MVLGEDALCRHQRALQDQPRLWAGPQDQEDQKSAGKRWSNMYFILNSFFSQGQGGSALGSYLVNKIWLQTRDAVTAARCPTNELHTAICIYPELIFGANSLEPVCVGICHLLQFLPLTEYFIRFWKVSVIVNFQHLVATYCRYWVFSNWKPINWNTLDVIVIVNTWDNCLSAQCIVGHLWSVYQMMRIRSISAGSHHVAMVDELNRCVRY